jgi:5-bromo-4-chloroindolyl phosphate hydrolysis protein
MYMRAMHEPQRFQKEDLFFYTALSSLASMAIENALLHARGRRPESGARLDPSCYGIVL